MRYVDARNPGENNDEFVWRQSSANAYFKSMHESGKNDFCVIGEFGLIAYMYANKTHEDILCFHTGDSDFPLQPYLMTPYQNPIESYEIIYNEKLLKAHKFIENCFNTIKNRFRCIAGDKAIYYLPEKATKIVNVCCAIHNACIFYKDNLEFDETDATDSNNHNCNNSAEFNNDTDATEQALEIRKNFAERLQTSKGCP